jgi:hypothetical protein
MRAYEILTEGKNPHMTHLEDLVLDNGYAGAVEALKYATGVKNMLSSGKGKASQVTVKWDGSPAIFTGIDPEDGKFFVGTKSALSKGVPKRIKSPADIEKFYSEVPELGEKLLAAFTHLRKLGIKNILQGDMMFSEMDVQAEKIAGEEVLTFTPNTITYAVPVDSDLARQIGRAKFGIVFHTSYDGGDSIHTAEKSFNIDISKLNKTPDVWYDDATYKDYTGVASLSPEEDNFLKQEIIAAKARISELGKENLNAIVTNPEFKKTIQPFINANVRAGSSIDDPAEFTKNFLAFYKERTLKGVEDLKPNFQQKRHDKIAAKGEFLEQNKNSVFQLIDLYNHLNRIKLTIIGKLNTIDGLKTFIKSGDGYDVTNPEGFVAIGHDGGAVKLVDRLEFSQQNFNRQPG